MLDHIGIPVTDVSRAKAFYIAALAPLGIGIIMEWEQHVGLGDGGKPYFWIAPGTVSAGLHIAFSAKTRAEVDAFYTAAIKAGGQDNGAPGLRPHYHPNYYGAFVHDADGHNIEAVCHLPE